MGFSLVVCFYLFLNPCFEEYCKIEASGLVAAKVRRDFNEVCSHFLCVSYRFYVAY